MKTIIFPMTTAKELLAQIKRREKIRQVALIIIKSKNNENPSTKSPTGN